MGTGTLPAEAFGAALASLPAMGPARLAALLGAWEPERAWKKVVAGTAIQSNDVARACGSDPRGVATAWRVGAQGIDVAATWNRHVASNIGVTLLGGPAYPAALKDDVEPPAVLFHVGDPDIASGRPRVAIVGTRAATRYGLDVAYELGHDLAAVGIVVVSGLAAGIDAAAHAGVLSGAAESVAPPLAVVGSGLDIVYPRQNRALWRRVESVGAIFSEAPLGGRPEPWRFPARNRIIAALADVIVVVESRERGGSMHTVTEAMERDRTVFAVPGPVRSAASAGTNRLLADGAIPCCGVDDVLMALGLSPASGRHGRGDPRPEPDDRHRAVLDAIGWQPTTLDELAGRADLDADLGTLAIAVTTLEAQGWLARRGAWLERVAMADR